MDFHVLRFSGKSKKENEKKYIYISSGFLMEIHLGDRFFSVEIRFYFSFFTANLYFKILTRIYQSKAPRTLEPFSQYSQLFWTLLNRNMIIFIQSTTLRLFDYLLRPSSTASFFKIGSSMSSLRVAVLSEGRGGYGYTQANPCLHFLGNFLSDNNT